MTDLNDGAATRAKDLRVGRLASHLDGFETCSVARGMSRRRFGRRLSSWRVSVHGWRGTMFRWACSGKSTPVNF